MDILRLFAAFLFCLLLAPVSASAQTAYIEGYVFDRKSGQPLGGVFVELLDNFTTHAIPIQLGFWITDSNGLYELPISRLFGFPVTVRATCITKKGSARSSSGLILREGNIRRDLYLDEGGKRIKECIPPTHIPRT